MMFFTMKQPNLCEPCFRLSLFEQQRFSRQPYKTPPWRPLIEKASTSCDCTKYNGGQCYNCLNGGHDICDDGRGVCSKTGRKEAQ
jgi:hypothetical protein